MGTQRVGSRKRRLVIVLCACLGGFGASASGELLRLQASPDQPGSEPPSAQPLQLLPPPPERTGNGITLWPGSAETAYSAAAQPATLSETGASVTVITAEELERRKVQTVAEALADVPGVDVVGQGGPGQFATAFLRGQASGRTIVLLDGVELNDPIAPGRGADLSKLTVDNVDRIEIVRGPQSAVFGTGAMSGVVNIITRQRAETPSASLAAEAGKYSSWLGKLTAAGAMSGLEASLGASLTNTQGFSAAKRDQVYPQPQPDLAPNGYRSLTGDLGLACQPATDVNLSWSQRYVAADTQLDNYGGDAGDTRDYTSAYHQYVTRLQAGLSLFDRLWQQTLSLGLNQTDRTTRNVFPYIPGDVLSDYHSTLLSLDWRHQFKSLVFGLAYRQDQGRFHDDNYYPPATLTERSAHLFGAYLENRFTWERLTLDAGVRWDLHDQYGSSTSFRLVPAYTLPGLGTHLKASYGTAFNAPSLFQLYSPFGNPKLQPETTTGWEAGLEQELKPVRAGVTYFSSAARDQIDFFSTGFLTGEYRNLDRVETKGWEAFAAAEPLPGLELRAAYTKLTANDLTHLDTLGPQALIRVADYKFTLAGLYRLDPVWLSASAMRVGPRWDTDFTLGENVVLSPYTLVNLVLGWNATREAQAYLKLENVLDTDYVETIGYNTPRFGAYVGVKITLQ